MGQTISAGELGLPETLLINVVNQRELLAAYGKEFDQAVRQAIRARLIEAGFAPESIDIEDEFTIVNLVDAPQWQTSLQHQLDQLTQYVRAALSQEPVVLGNYRAYLQVFTDFIFKTSCDRDMEAHELFTTGGAVSRHNAITALHELRRNNLRGDMLAATELIDDLRASRLLLAFQPILLIGNRRVAAYLYHEVLLRRSESGSTNLPPSAWPNAIEASERLGWICRLDSSIIWTAIRLLEQYPEQRLGCNVSAASLYDDAWWNLLLAYLEINRHVAERLTLEITETSVITQSNEAMQLIDRLHLCGARIAIDDMGAGHSTLEFLARAHADVVKIDRSILLRSFDPNQPPDLLSNMVKLCADYSPCVIVEGVETAAELMSACHAGAKGVQGFLIQKPDTQPTWLQVGPIPVIDSYACIHPPLGLTANLPTTPKTSVAYEH